MNPDEEYVVMPVSVLEKLLRYASSVCHSHCPEDREAETCVYMSRLSRAVGLGSPPCTAIYGDFSRDTFLDVARSLERKYRANIKVIVSTMSRRGPNSVEEHSDFLEATFALGMLEYFAKRGNNSIYLVRGRDLEVKGFLTRI